MVVCLGRDGGDLFCGLPLLDDEADSRFVEECEFSRAPWFEGYLLAVGVEEFGVGGFDSGVNFVYVVGLKA